MGKVTETPKVDGRQRLGPYELDCVYNVDCIEGMKALPLNSVDVAIADPPYNASKGNVWKWDNSVALPGFGGDWSKIMAAWDDMPLSDYLTFTLAWVTELKRIVRPTGSLWIHGTYHNIGIINFALQLTQIEIINEVVWYKRNSFPNLSGRRLTASHETILWAHTGKGRKYLFNYEASKAMECPEDGLKEAGKQMRTVWDIPNNKERSELVHGKHPAQKPVRLINRMLAVSGKEGQVLLAPFAGSGTECFAAKERGLRFLGFETDPNHVELCRVRLAQCSLMFPEIKETLEQKNWRGRRTGTIPSLIKWTGSKRSQAAKIAEFVPEHSRYIEPFLGGGALLYLVAIPGAIVGDIYRPLIDLWLLVQREPMRVIDDYKAQWSALQDDLPAYFYSVRDRFNQEQNPLDLSFLTRTCVNGIVRFNHKGEFNNSFHLSRRGMDPKRFAQVVQDWTRTLNGVRVLCQDYQQTTEEAKSGDFVYLDPPYAGSKNRYIENLDLDRMFGELDSLNSRGVMWALSFDGKRGSKDFSHPVPEELYKRRLLISSGHSALSKVLNGPFESVEESLYLNY